jgi:hypothetical protein
VQRKLCRVQLNVDATNILNKILIGSSFTRSLDDPIAAAG